MSVYLVSYATRPRAGMEPREAVDVVNDFGRDTIGEEPEERVSDISISPETYSYPMCSTYRSTAGSQRTSYTTHGMTLHQSWRSGRVMLLRWALLNLTEMKTGNESDLLEPSSGDSQY
jgi:hypothetical protein